MKRRCNAHDYSRSGLYHITISVAKALRQPLGRMAGKLEKPDGDIDAPHVALSAIGQMVEKELRNSITKYYPMLEVLVSARISKGEQEIMDSVLLSGFPVIRIEDNGFPEIYHPSGDRLNGCATGKLLLLTPWVY